MAGHPEADPAEHPGEPGEVRLGQAHQPAEAGAVRNPHGSIQALFDDCATAAADRLIAAYGGPAWDEASFRKLYDKVRADLVDLTVRTVGQVQQILAAWQACERRLKSTNSLALINNVTDVRDHLAP